MKRYLLLLFGFFLLCGCEEEKQNPMETNQFFMTSWVGKFVLPDGMEKDVSITFHQEDGGFVSLSGTDELYYEFDYVVHEGEILTLRGWASIRELCRNWQIIEHTKNRLYLNSWGPNNEGYKLILKSN